MKCNKLQHLRLDVLEKIKKINKNFVNLNTNARFQWLMVSEDNTIISYIDKLLNILNDERNKIIESSTGTQ